MRKLSRTTKVIAATILLVVLAFALTGFLYVTGIHRIRHEQVRVPSRGVELAATISIQGGDQDHSPRSFVHGSGPAKARDMRIVWRNLVPEGIVVLTYDKPGVGESSGRFEEVRTNSSEQQLNGIADDVLACLEMLKKHPQVDPNRVGLFGGSQAGWIIPLACDKQKDIPSAVILSGPATSYGLEMYFSSLTGEGLRPGLGLSSEEIEQRLDAYNGPVGFEPLPVLARSRTPTMWLQGERDISVPARRSAKILNHLRAQGVPYTIKVYPKGDHNLQDDTTKAQLKYWPDILDWLRQQQALK